MTEELFLSIEHNSEPVKYLRRIGRPKTIKEIIIKENNEEEIIKNYSKRKIGRPKTRIESEIKRNVGRPRNPETMDPKDYRKYYYNNNKDKFNREICCEICKISLTVSCRSRHLKTKSHIQNCLKNLIN